MEASFSGVSKSTDADGYYTYTRPEGKQGGHGVGWSELPRYAFKVPPGWSEKAVSIADLGGTEVQEHCLVLLPSANCCSALLVSEALSTALFHLKYRVHATVHFMLKQGSCCIMNITYLPY